MKYILLQSIRFVASLVGRAVKPLVMRNQRIMNFLENLYVMLTTATLKAKQRDALKSFKKAKRNFTGPSGVNVLGYLTAENGLGEAARANIRAMKEVGIPYSLLNISSAAREGDDTFSEFAQDNPYVFNLVHVNADYVPHLLNQKGIDFFKNKYNIGFWYWELSNFPEEWMDSFFCFHEIWVASTFCRDAIQKVSPVPVVKIPPPVTIGKIKKIDRAHFGLEDESFIFLFMFDFMSVFERKNPIAVIEAFRSAFRRDDRALLVLKCSNSGHKPALRKKFLEAAEGLNVKFIEGYLDKDELHALMSHCDCYVSLHRSEGFGLPIAEAMLMGKPVIATGYSSNVDFMNRDNGFLVDYRLVEIEHEIPPYRKGNVWAEPDVRHASELMRMVYEDRELSATIGRKASDYIKSNFNLTATGRKILKRLEQIMESKGLPPFRKM